MNWDLMLHLNRQDAKAAKKSYFFKTRNLAFLAVNIFCWDF